MHRHLPRHLALAATLALSASALAQPKDNKPAPAPSFNGTVLVIDHAALDAFFVDPKDRPMADALAMIPARVRELPREVPNVPGEAPGLANMALYALSRPGRLAVTYTSDAPTGGGFGYGAAFSVLMPDKGAADDMHAKVGALVTQAAAKGGPRVKTGQGTRFTGMSDIQTPAALLSFGPRQAADGWRYEFIAGTMDHPDAVAEALPTAKNLPAPRGFEPVIRASFDLAGLNPAMEMAKGFAANNPQAAEGIAQLQAMGLGGPNAIHVSYAAGYTKDQAYSVTAIQGAKKVAATLSLSDRPLTKTDLAAIPADATDAYMRSAENHWGEKIDAMSAKNPAIQQGLNEFQRVTGVDLKADILATLGGTTGVYLSDSTGGGSLASAVVLVSLKDKAKFTASFNKLVAVANSQAEKLPMGPGYIRLVPWKDGDSNLVSLRFPGLPVPLEITFAMTGDWFIAAPTPQAAIAASRQAAGHGDAGLLSNKVFAAGFPEGKQVTTITFSDTSRNLAAGYPLLSMAGSAVSNMVRSPVDPGREPGMTVPLYNDLRRNIRAHVAFSYWRGDDLLTENHTDRSLLVNAAGSAGLVMKIVPALAIPAAAAGGIFQEMEQKRHRGGGRVLVPAGSPLEFFAEEAVNPFSPERTALAIAAVLQAAQPEAVRP